MFTFSSTSRAFRLWIVFHRLVTSWSTSTARINRAAARPPPCWACCRPSATLPECPRSISQVSDTRHSTALDNYFKASSLGAVSPGTLHDIVVSRLQALSRKRARTSLRGGQPPAPTTNHLRDPVPSTCRNTLCVSMTFASHD